MKKTIALGLLLTSFFANAEYIQGSFGNILVKMDDDKATVIQSETWHCVRDHKGDNEIKGDFGSVEEVLLFQCPKQKGMGIKMGFNEKLGQVTFTVLNNNRVAWNDTEDYSVLSKVQGDFQ